MLLGYIIIVVCVAAVYFKFHTAISAYKDLKNDQTDQ